MELCKFTTYDNTTAPQYRIYTTINISSNPKWISADIQARIDPPPISLFNN